MCARHCFVFCTVGEHALVRAPLSPGVADRPLHAASSSSGGVDTYLGLLYPTDAFQVFGYLSNTNVKLIVVADDADIKDVDIKSVRTT